MNAAKRSRSTMTDIAGQFAAGQNAEVCSPFGEFCYLAFIAIFCALKALGFYEGQTIFTIGLVIACVLMIGKIVSTNHTIPEYVMILALLGMGGLVYLNTGEKSLLVNLMVIAGIKGVSVRKTLQTGLTVWGTGFLLLSGLTLLGLHADSLYVQNKNGIGMVLRHALGQTHQNVLNTCYLCICAIILYLAADRFTRRQKAVLLAILTAGSVYIFLYCVSYTGLLSCLLLYAAYLYVTLRGKLTRAEQALAELILPLCLIFSIAGPVLMKGKLFDLFDRILNNRFYLSRYFLTEQPITLFGTRLYYPNFSYSIDCSYVYLLSQLGLIPFLVMILLYMGTIHQMIRQERNAELAVTLVLCIAAVVEPFLFNLGFKSVSLVFLGESLYGLMKPHQEYRILRAETPALSPLCRTFTQVPRSVCHLGGEILQVWMRSWKYYILLFAGVFLLGVGGSFLLQPSAETIYINSEILTNDYGMDNGAVDAVYLTAEEVRAIRSKGNLVYQYRNEETLMYVYKGTIVEAENARQRFSIGLWAAAFCCCTTAAIQQYSRRKDLSSPPAG